MNSMSPKMAPMGDLVRTSATGRKLLQMYMCLPLLPPELAIQGLNAIADFINENKIGYKVVKMHTYIAHQWFLKVRI